ncbi:Phage-related baseplate assembly protein [Planctomycetes bacterium Pan216]|uniref:Phage-related baseplate assembly protein n=1 Tax=Kolteria novifilia TaxID=2527975 RepID=A0A518B3U7_9BACT|nr:Phage-related baseplate assembly protein [Planctomycetes bacterium Pan216]
MPVVQRNARAFVGISSLEAFLPVYSVKGYEGLSELYEFRVNFSLEEDHSLELMELLGTPLTLYLVPDWCPEEEVTRATPESLKHARIIQGICWNVDHESDPVRRQENVHLILSPTVRALTLQVRNRIFQQRTIREILDTVLSGLRLSYQLRREYPPHNYCVQYQESDWAFAARLMEEEGIYYSFIATDAGEELVIADTSIEAASVSLSNEAGLERASNAIRYGTHFMEDQERRPQVSSLRKGRRMCSTQFTQADTNFQIADRLPLAKRDVDDAGTKNNASREVRKPQSHLAHRFDCVGPDRQDQPDQLGWIESLLQRSVDMDCEREQLKAIEIVGKSNVPQFNPGLSFALAETPRKGESDGNYLLVSVDHELRGDDYGNTFRAITAQQAYRPPLRTPVPDVRGHHTATVVGPKGEEIYTDKYGRIKVEFPWASPNASDQVSCWVRVAQAWAGGQWGAFALPRVGQQVIIDFEDGDPDQPLVIGSVYNSRQPPPVSLPADRSKFMLKSKTHHGNDFHGLMFDDQMSRPGVKMRSSGTYHFQAKENVGHDYGGHFLEHHRGSRHTVVGAFPPFLGPGQSLDQLEENRSSSGEGAGDSVPGVIDLNDDRSGEEYTPLDWSAVEYEFANPQIWGQFVFWAQMFGVVGIEQQFVIGNCAETTVDPTALAGFLGGTVLGAMFEKLAQGLTTVGGGPGLMGQAEFVYGHFNEIFCGPTFFFHRGHKVEMGLHENLDGEVFFQIGEPLYFLMHFTEYVIEVIFSDNTATHAAIASVEALRTILIVSLRKWYQRNCKLNSTDFLDQSVSQINGLIDSRLANPIASISNHGTTLTNLTNSLQALTAKADSMDIANSNVEFQRGSFLVKLPRDDDAFMVRSGKSVNTLSVKKEVCSIQTATGFVSVGDGKYKAESGKDMGVTGVRLDTIGDGTIEFRRGAEKNSDECGHTLCMDESKFSFVSEHKDKKVFEIEAKKDQAVVRAKNRLTLAVGSSSISIEDGKISLDADAIEITGQKCININGKEIFVKGNNISNKDVFAPPANANGGAGGFSNNDHGSEWANQVIDWMFES